MIGWLLLLCFLWQAGVCVLANEDSQAEFYGDLWNKFLEDTGIKLD